MARVTLPGFHPDPSICRVGDDYYIATSSFEYAPGIPIHHSTDLDEWKLVGYAVPDASVIAAASGQEGASKGLYAPTLRYRQGTFYLITTSINRIAEGHLLTTAVHPSGPWSTPQFIAGTLGIDPDLAWHAGEALLTWKDPMKGSIVQAAIDLEAAALLEDPRSLWQGSGLGEVEGPHLIERDGWWYLLVAEGGTHTGHGVSVARADSPRGPFETHPNNPIYTHRSTSHAVQAVGHADMVEDPSGKWHMVHHGIRQSGSFPRFHVNGRESFIADISWRDGWPVAKELQDTDEIPSTSFLDDFSWPTLHARWVAPGVMPELFASTGYSGLSLVPSDGRQAVLCTRVKDADWTATADLGPHAFLGLRVDAHHRVAIYRNDNNWVARVTIGGFSHDLGVVPWETGDRGVVRVRRNQHAYGPGFGPDRVSVGIGRAGKVVEVGSIDGRYLSTEVAGGFTGRMLELGVDGARAVVRHIEYTQDTVPPLPRPTR